MWQLKLSENHKQKNLLLVKCILYERKPPLKPLKKFVLLARLFYYFDVDWDFEEIAMLPIQKLQKIKNTLMSAPSQNFEDYRL